MGMSRTFIPPAVLFVQLLAFLLHYDMVGTRADGQ